MTNTKGKISPKEALRDMRGPLNGLIFEAMKRDGISELTRWADHWNIGRTTLYDLVRGRETSTGVWVKPSLDTLITLSRAFQTPIQDLISLLDPAAKDLEQFSGNIKYPVHCAGWAGAGPDQAHITPEDYIYVETEFARGKDLVAFKISGNSMNGGSTPINDGDIVLVNRLDHGQPNMPVVVRLDNDGYVCKRIRSGGFLDSANPEFQDPDLAIIPTSRVSEMVGRVVRIIKDV